MLVVCLGNHKKKDYVSSVSRSVNTGKGGECTLSAMCLSKYKKKKKKDNKTGNL